MQCFVVGAGSDEICMALSALAQDLGLPIAMVASLAKMKADRRFVEAPRPLVLIPDAPFGALDVAEAIDFAREQGGRTFVVCLAASIAPNEYKQLVRTGSAEWITLRDYEQELRDLIARINAAATPKCAATVLSFVPSKGGVGNTTLLIEVAIHLSTRRKRSGLRIAILDLNLQGGTAADALDLDPRFDVAEIVDRPERLDEQLIDIFASRHSNGLDVFASPLSRISTDAIKPDLIFTFIDSIASRYDAILFDLPAQWSPWTDNLLRGSDAVIVCGGESVPALRRLAATLLHLDTLTIAESKLAAVVNPVASSLLGRISRRAVIARAMAGRRTFLVRRDDGSTGAALDVGRPLLELVPNSRIARDVRRLAEWIETIVDHSPTAHSRPKSVRGAA